LHGDEATAALKAKDPHFLVRHDTDLFTMAARTRQSLQKNHGSGPGELFDPARFAKTPMRWGRDGEVAEMLDWSRMVTFSGMEYGFDHGSCRPGSDVAEWEI